MRTSMEAATLPRPGFRLQRHLGELALLAGILAVVALRLWQLRGDDAPSGADGGDCLAFAYQMSGQHFRAAAAASPPVIPALIWALMAVTTPLIALKVVAVLSSVAVAIPFYALARREAPGLIAA